MPKEIDDLAEIEEDISIILLRKEAKEAFKYMSKSLINSSPLILMGRGGSGTRMLSHFAEDVGYFLGNKLNPSKDSIEWTELTFEIIKFYGGEIELPTDEKKYRDQILSKANEVLYTGNYPKKWGWKMPQTLLYFPILANVFPNAKFVHIIRHPIPCLVGSGKVKADKTAKMHGLGNFLLPSAYSYFHGSEEKLKELDPNNTIQQILLGAYSWNHQVDRAIKYGRESLGDRYLEIKYEDVCRDPQEEFQKFCEFLQIKESKTSLTIKKSQSSENLRDLETLTHKKKKVTPAVVAEIKKKGGLQVKEICKKTAEKVGYKL